MSTILIHLPNTPLMLANVINEDDGYITLKDPLLMVDDNTYIYTSHYMPFAKDNVVTVNKHSIISTANPEEHLLSRYTKAVASLNSKKKSEYLEENANPLEELAELFKSAKSKNLH